MDELRRKTPDHIELDFIVEFLQLFCA